MNQCCPEACAEALGAAGAETTTVSHAAGAGVHAFLWNILPSFRLHFFGAGAHSGAGSQAFLWKRLPSFRPQFFGAGAHAGAGAQVGAGAQLALAWQPVIAVITATTAKLTIGILPH